MGTLSMSSYSVREHLGPIDLTFVTDDGVEHRFRQDHPRLLSLPEFARRVRREFGVEAAETVAFQFSGVDDPELGEFAAALAEHDVQLLDVAVDHGDLLREDEGRRAQDVAELERWIDRCAALGSRFVRVNPGSPFSSRHGEEPPQHLVDALVALGRRAEAAGTRLLVENHGGPSSDPVWMTTLLDACAPHVGLLLDLGNFDVLTGPVVRQLQHPDEEVDLFALDLSSLYEGIDALAGRAELVHVKAHHVGDDGTVGPVDLERALAILDRHGYRGPLTVEYEGSGADPWAGSRRVLDLTRSPTARAGGTPR